MSHVHFPPRGGRTRRLMSCRKLATTISTTFSVEYAMQWASFFPDEPLTRPYPTFDGRCVLYPKRRNVRDYLRWRQVDCKTSIFPYPSAISHATYVLCRSTAPKSSASCLRQPTDIPRPHQQPLQYDLLGSSPARQHERHRSRALPQRHAE